MCMGTSPTKALVTYKPNQADGNPIGEVTPIDMKKPNLYQL